MGSSLISGGGGMCRICESASFDSSFASFIVTESLQFEVER